MFNGINFQIPPWPFQYLSPNSRLYRLRWTGEVSMAPRSINSSRIRTPSLNSSLHQMMCSPLSRSSRRSLNRRPQMWFLTRFSTMLSWPPVLSSFKSDSTTEVVRARFPVNQCPSIHHSFSSSSNYSKCSSRAW